ncbi:FixH family protein [Psychrobacter sp. I-STPA10]|uniref:FixH family protein n=1 Tax=Psychrobacter sp. I-STPA10 TaxID=2585769 RepID=UPI001E2AE123|nr:FixH family protein [Psychrobacter sp. I-STPA10]
MANHNLPSSKTATPPNDFKHQDSQPWYKNYMVIIFVIGLPAFVVVACIWFVYYSMQIKDTVVRDDWYMDGKTLYQDVSRDKLAHDLDINGKMVFNADNSIDFYLDYPQQSLQDGILLNGAPLTYPKTLDLSISHATDINKDRETQLLHQQDNHYTATVQLDPLPSKYYVQVSNQGEQNWRLREVGQLPQAKISFHPLKTFDDIKE